MKRPEIAEIERAELFRASFPGRDKVEIIVDRAASDTSRFSFGVGFQKIGRRQGNDFQAGRYLFV